MARSQIAEKKLTVVGAGIVAAMEVYFAHRAALARGEKLRVTMYEKNPDIRATTSYNLAPSLSFNEAMAVLPPEDELVEKINLPFVEAGGMRVDDVLLDGVHVNDREASLEFIHSVMLHGQDHELQQRQRDALITLGKRGMALWNALYDSADIELRRILDAAHFNPCKEPDDASSKKLHDGYRVNLMVGVPDAAGKAQERQAYYHSQGYLSAMALTPAQVLDIDPSLAAICEKHSTSDSLGVRTWNDDTAACWGPAGCIDASIFLPRFYEYLRTIMGQYTNE